MFLIRKCIEKPNKTSKEGIVYVNIHSGGNELILKKQIAVKIVNE